MKTYVFFKGRSIIFKDQGEILLLRLAQELEHVGKVDQMPKLEGKRMIMMMSPKKRQNNLSKEIIVHQGISPQKSLDYSIAEYYKFYNFANSLITNT